MDEVLAREGKFRSRHSLNRKPYRPQIAVVSGTPPSAPNFKKKKKKVVYVRIVIDLS